MSQTKRGATAVTGMVMVVLATALMVPAVMVSLDSPQTITVTQAENERIVLTGAISTEAV